MAPSGIQTSLLELSLSEFLAKTNQERPEITGGCVLLTNASLNTAMILMALKISLKRCEVIGKRRLLKEKLIALSKIQSVLVDAAAQDLKVFDEYRGILKSKAKNRQIRLDHALENATDSLLGICKTLNQAIAHTEVSKDLVDSTVLSDLIAGKMIFEAVFAALIALAEGNIASMPPAAQLKYEQWKEALQSI